MKGCFLGMSLGFGLLFASIAVAQASPNTPARHSAKPALTSGLQCEARVMDKHNKEIGFIKNGSTLYLREGETGQRVYENKTYGRDYQQIVFVNDVSGNLYEASIINAKQLNKTTYKADFKVNRNLTHKATDWEKTVRMEVQIRESCTYKTEGSVFYQYGSLSKVAQALSFRMY